MGWPAGHRELARQLQILYWRTLCRRKLDAWSDEILMREYERRYGAGVR